MASKGQAAASGGQGRGHKSRSVKFELYGLEIVEKQVAASGKSGRVYLPMDWLGKRVKIVRLD
ncbi:MAG: DUF2080 family transposase-associated protein [Desulfarculaceae bacterium]|nr:DUF2080 family transposase-associated protein [Desulfarculaceae bacterium]MCF8072037.1 DUF2080 family transposase-associated protein [Desulfarculaceae bacterium]MCF8101554.1 DUF2080 family transposase-associated protein [Desulfarculaceae bacterium]MCF8115104.1 DUF2080 family transposase-associated protein [Desulfarculaceae bacterium]